jgi:hypothetical protein
MALVVLAAGASAQPAESLSGVIRVSAKITDVRIDGFGIGQQRIEKYRLWNRSITPVPIGNGALICTYLGDHRSYCDGQFVMPLGKLSVAGTRRQVYRAFLIVTGGTRAYYGAVGTFSMLQGDEPRTLTLVFRVN